MRPSGYKVDQIGGILRFDTRLSSNTVFKVVNLSRHGGGGARKLFIDWFSWAPQWFVVISFVFRGHQHAFSFRSKCDVINTSRHWSNQIVTPSIQIGICFASRHPINTNRHISSQVVTPSIQIVMLLVTSWPFQGKIVLFLVQSSRGIRHLGGTNVIVIAWCWSNFEQNNIFKTRAKCRFHTVG